MNELSLEVKAKETHEKAIGYYRVSEQYGYKFIMEVKKIRDERLYKQLGYSNFDDYCKDAWGVDRKFISEKITLADNYSENEFVGYSRQLGHKKSLLLARMPEEQRKQVIEEGIPTKEGVKSVEEATQQEISTYKKALKEAEIKVKQAQKSEEIALRQLEEAEEDKQRLGQLLTEERNKEPKVITKEVVVEVDNEKLEQQVKAKEQEINNLKSELNMLKKKQTFNEAESEKEIKYLNYEASKTVLSLKLQIEEFLKEVAITAFRKGAIAASSEGTKRKLEEGIEELEDFCAEMRLALNGRIDLSKQGG